MKTAHCPNLQSRDQFAFTLTELLVVIAMLALLATVALSARSTTKDQVKITQCAGNLRQFTQALLIYGQENNDRLPSGFPGIWPSDIPRALADAVASYGLYWKTLYCPGTSPRFSDADNRLLYEFNTWNCIVGYATTLSNSWNVVWTNCNLTVSPHSVNAIQPGAVFPPPLASRRVLLADATISGQEQRYFQFRYSYNWTHISGGLYTTNVMPPPYMTPHMEGRIPAGGNVGMLDGHIEWRDFDDMIPRTAMNSQTPTFWW